MICGVYFYLYIRKINRTNFNPILVYILVWTPILYLYDLRLIEYYPLETKTYWIIFLVPVLLIMGYTFFTIVFNNYTIGPLQKPANSKSFKVLSNIIYGALFFRVFTVVLGVYLSYGSLGAVFTNGMEIYNDSRHSGNAPGLGLFLPVDWISALMLGREVYDRRRRRVVLLVVLAIICMNLALQARLSLLLSLTFFIGSYVANGGCRVRIQAKLVFLIVSLVSGLGFIISLSRGLSNHNVSGEWGAYSGTALPSIYYYMTNGVAGFNAYIGIGDDERSLLYSLEPLWRLLSNFDGSIVSSKYEEITYNTPAPTIIATWLKFLVDDFGILGGAIILFFLGSLIRYIELKCNKSNSFFWPGLYSLILVTFVLSFFGYTFFLNGFWLAVIFIFLGNLLVDRNLLSTLTQKVFRK